VVEATADSADALREAARQPLAQWVASGTLQLVGAPGHAALDTLRAHESAP
jgi:hypothetical protein